MSEVLTARDGGVLTITLNRPDVLNAFNGACTRRCATALERGALARRARRRAHGRRPRLLLRPGPEGVPRGAGDIGRGSRDLPPEDPSRSAALEKPVIAAVNGPCAGAGLSLACACDLRIAADAASFVPGFIGIGLVPDSGGSWFLHRLLGPARAFEWLTSNRKLPAAEALAWGLVSEVSEADALAARAAELAGPSPALRRAGSG